MAQMKASIVIDLLDRATKPLKSLSGAVGATSKAAGKAGAQGAAATKKLGGMSSVLGGLAKRLGSSRNGADRLGRELRGLSSETRGAASETSRLVEWQDRLGRSARRAREAIGSGRRALDGYLRRAARRPRAPLLGGFGRGVLGGFAGGALFQASGAAMRLPGGFLGAAAQMETLEVSLGTIEKSSQKARESMRWISDFAATTPFQMDQVADAFVQMRANNIDPRGGVLRGLGDLASVMKKDIGQAVEALADARRGQNDRLTELGIGYLTEGDTATYTLGGQSRTASRRDPAAIQAALLGLIQGNVGGAMQDRMKTWDGMVSNLGDQWFRFRLLVMDGGPFDFLKQRLGSVLGEINEMASSGELQRLADRLSEGILGAMGEAQKLWGVFRDDIWPVLIEDIWPAMKDIGGVMLELFKHANKIAEAIGGWGVVLKGAVYGFVGRKLLAGLTGLYGEGRKGLEWLDKKRKSEQAQALRRRGGRIAKAARGLASRGLDAAAPLASGAKNMAKSGWGRLSGWLLRIGRVVAPFAMVALKGLGAVFASLAGVISGPVLAAAAAIGVAGVLIWKSWEPIKGFFGKLWDGVKKAFSGAWKWISEIDWGGLGMRLLETLAAGIQAAAGLPFKALEFALGKLRDLLPGSDARTGPLSRLTASGMAILPTMGEGVRRSGAGPLQRPLARALGTAAAGLALSAPAPAFRIAPGAPATAAEPARPGVTRVVHHHYRITIQQEPGEDSSELADRLIRELENRQALAGREALGDAY